MKKIKVGITGCMGRMGQQLIKTIRSNRNFELSALTEGKKIKKEA